MQQKEKQGLDRRSHLSCHFWVIEFDASRWRLVRLARHQPEIMWWQCSVLSRPSSNNRYNSTWQSTQQWTFARCKKYVQEYCATFALQMTI